MRDTLELQLSELQSELDDLYTMSEEAACFRYNTSSKQSAIDMLNDEITCISAKLADKSDDNDEYAGWCDPAFHTMADFYRMRV